MLMDILCLELPAEEGKSYVISALLISSQCISKLHMLVRVMTSQSCKVNFRSTVDDIR